MDAYLQAQQAAQHGSAADAIRSAETLAQAAQTATMVAQAMGANPAPASFTDSHGAGGTPNLAGSPGQSAGNQTGAGGGAGGGPGNKNIAVGMMDPLQDRQAFENKLGKNMREWLRESDKLKEDVMQVESTEGPEEYRQMIRQYFSELSKQEAENKF